MSPSKLAAGNTKPISISVIVSIGLLMQYSLVS